MFYMISDHKFQEVDIFFANLFLFFSAMSIPSYAYSELWQVCKDRVFCKNS